MSGSTIVWIIVAIIVVGGVVAFVMSRSGSWREGAERAKAAELRERAAEHDRELREREAAATEARAQAETARAEAQKQQLEAERLAQEAETRADHAGTARQERDEQLRLADLRDPDVRTDDEGYRIDEHGNRVRDGVPGVNGLQDAGREEHARHDDLDGDGVRDDLERDGARAGLRHEDFRDEDVRHDGHGEVEAGRRDATDDAVDRPVDATDERAYADGVPRETPDDDALETERRTHTAERRDVAGTRDGREA